MADVQIEREVVIDAPLEVVWRTVTEPEQISQWFAECTKLELKPGGLGMLLLEGHADPIVVQVVEPPNRFSFSWNHPIGQEPVPGNSMLVEFTLVALESDRTRLRVVESGHELHDWPDSEKTRYAEEHRGGWGTFLDRLARLLAERAEG
jgi:uncharacterized protein YndB with AHSA1/START domain